MHDVSQIAQALLACKPAWAAEALAVASMTMGCEGGEEWEEVVQIPARSAKLHEL